MQAQFLYDRSSPLQWFGREVPVIALGHTIPFFAEVADALLTRFIIAGATFIPLECLLNPLVGLFVAVNHERRRRFGRGGSRGYPSRTVDRAPGWC